jgi:flagellin-like protein
MWTWLTSNIITVVLFIAFTLVLCYALWLRSKMTRSKAQFALAAIATLVSFVTVGLKFLTGSGPFKVSSTILFVVREQTGVDTITPPNWFVLSLGVFLISLALILIYLLALNTIQNWRGPITVNVNELAKQN